MDLQLKGRTAVVTGASSGIGRAIALELGREGVRLAVTARRGEHLETLAADIAAAGGEKPAIVVHDAMSRTMSTRWSRGRPPRSERCRSS